MISQKLNQRLLFEKGAPLSSLFHPKKVDVLVPETINNAITGYVIGITTDLFPLITMKKVQYTFQCYIYQTLFSENIYNDSYSGRVYASQTFIVPCFKLLRKWIKRSLSRQVHNTMCSINKLSKVRSRNFIHIQLLSDVNRR